jgi:hypothetical protein
MAVSQQRMTADTPIKWVKPYSSQKDRGRMEKIYRSIFIALFSLTFMASWYYVSVNFGQFGLFFGWIPSLVVAFVFAGLWPLAIVLAGTAYFISNVFQTF